ncbi:MAG: hypothetical protein LBU58_12230, partial [Clostridiales bacterium]|nr:hypothetical protein [Clostridiales bacterium]
MSDWERTTKKTIIKWARRGGTGRLHAPREPRAARRRSWAALCCIMLAAMLVVCTAAAAPTAAALLQADAVSASSGDARADVGLGSISLLPGAQEDGGGAAPGPGPAAPDFDSDPAGPGPAGSGAAASGPDLSLDLPDFDSAPAPDFDSGPAGSDAAAFGSADSDAASADPDLSLDLPDSDSDPAGSDSDPADSDTDTGALSALLESSDDFDVGDWLGGFNPDADFGGLGGIEQETGPGTVNIHVVNTKGEDLDGMVITENGFRTDKLTNGAGAYEVTQVPYGERLYGVYLTYSYELDSVRLQKHEKQADGTESVISVGISDGLTLPPVDITDETLVWDITVVLRESLKIKVHYYMVSPNDRFYDLRPASDFLPDASDFAAESDPSAVNELAGENPFADADSPAADDGGGNPFFSQAEDEDAAAYHAYQINTFEGSPVRLAIYAEMPALRNVSSVRLVGEGFGDAAATADAAATEPAPAEPAAATADAAAPATDTTVPAPWQIEGAYGDFSMPDWTFTDRTWQLLSQESAVEAGDSI